MLARNKLALISVGTKCLGIFMESKSDGYRSFGILGHDANIPCCNESSDRGVSLRGVVSRDYIRVTAVDKFGRVQDRIRLHFE